jgi:hypothetical protein
MEAVRTSETSVHFNVTTRCYIPNGYKLYTRRRENLKSHKIPQSWSNSFGSYRFARLHRVGRPARSTNVLMKLHSTYGDLSVNCIIYSFTSGLFKHAVSRSEYIASNEVTTDGNKLEGLWKGCGRNWSWPNVWSYPGSYLQGIWKTTKHLSL